MQYQLRQALPYFIKRWIFFQRSATLKPLYQFEGKKHPETNRAVQDKVAESLGTETNGAYGTEDAHHSNIGSNNAGTGHSHTGVGHTSP